MNVPRLLYRVPDAAEALGLSRARVYELMADGEIPSVKIGAARRIPVADLEAYVDHLRSLEQQENGAIGLSVERKSE